MARTIKMHRKVINFLTRTLSSLVSIRANSDGAENLIIWILMILFIALVSLGVTGSSLGIGMKGSGLVVNSGTYVLGTKPRDIRSDEWLVLAPMAVSQINHVPAAPIHNRNLGPDGQNMLIVGMTGMPVAHISALGKPATWGFFFFDLKRALAWYWWMPIFASLGAVWSLIKIGLKLRWDFALGCALITVFSPYMTAWSYWPAYTLLFPSLVLISIIKIHTCEKLKWQLGWASLFIIGITGFFLVLYPAWQIPLAYLFLVLFVGIYVRDRLWIRGSIDKYFIIFIALLISLAVIYLWWIDARDAIDAIRNTVYPGQRDEVTGGDIQNWFFSKGYLTPWSMFATLPGTNQSEAASFFYFFIPLGVLLIFAAKNRDREIMVVGALLLFIFVSLFYQYFGFNINVAKYSLWGRTTSHRVDLALGFAQTLLLATLIASLIRHENPISVNFSSKTAFLAVIISVSLGFYFISGIPVEWRLHNKFFLAQYVAIALLGISSYFLLVQQFGRFLGFLSCISLLVALLFNPIYVPPKKIELMEGSVWNDANFKKINITEAGRVLVIGSQVPAMALLAAGVQVMDTVQYYPQSSIWNALDPAGKYFKIYNRYQHLVFYLDSLPLNIDRTITSPQADLVNVTVDGARFDFRTLPIQLVIGGVEGTELLKYNQSLAYVGMVGSFRVYNVLKK